MSDESIVTANAFGWVDTHDKCMVQIQNSLEVLHRKAAEQHARVDAQAVLLRDALEQHWADKRFPSPPTHLGIWEDMRARARELAGECKQSITSPPEIKEKAPKVEFGALERDVRCLADALHSLTFAVKLHSGFENRDLMQGARDTAYAISEGQPVGQQPERVIIGGNRAGMSHMHAAEALGTFSTDDPWEIIRSLMTVYSVRSPGEYSLLLSLAEFQRVYRALRQHDKAPAKPAVPSADEWEEKMREAVVLYDSEKNSPLLGSRLTAPVGVARELLRRHDAAKEASDWTALFLYDGEDWAEAVRELLTSPRFEYSAQYDEVRSAHAMLWKMLCCYDAAKEADDA